MLRAVCASAFAAGAITLCAASGSAVAAPNAIPCAGAAETIAAADNLPQPTDAATAQTDVDQIQSAVDCMVTNDLSPGHQNAEKYLTSSDKIVQAAAITAVPLTETDADPAPDSSAENGPGGPGCWGKHLTRYIVGFSDTVSAGRRSVEEDGWCGDGVSVTSVDGPIYNSATTSGFCWTNVDHNSGYKSGPAGPHVWWHEQNNAELGVGFSWGCFGRQKVQPGLSVKGNGYWDHSF